MKKAYLILGVNGAGKTTFYKKNLKDKFINEDVLYINADEIKQELVKNGLESNYAKIKSGQVAVSKMSECIKQNKNLLWILVSYDEIGPTIANYLATDQNKENLARVIYWKFIKPSCDFVNKNDMISAIEYYKLMTTYLIHHYNIPYNYNYNLDIKDLNKNKVLRNLDLISHHSTF